MLVPRGIYKEFLNSNVNFGINFVCFDALVLDLCSSCLPIRFGICKSSPHLLIAFIIYYLSFHAKKPPLTNRFIRLHLAPFLACLHLISFLFSLKNAASNEKSHPFGARPIACLLASSIIFLFA